MLAFTKYGPGYTRWIVCIMAASLIHGEVVPQRRTMVAVVVNKTNSLSNIEVPELRRLLLGDVRTWGNQRRVTLVQRETKSVAHQTSLDLVIRMTGADYRRYLLSREFQGQEPVALKVLNSADGACEFVANVPGAIALVEAESAMTPPCMVLIKVLAVNHKLPGETGYALR